MPSVPEERIHSEKQMAHMSSELLDTESSAAFRIVVLVQRRYAQKRNTVENLEALRDELLTRLAEIGILATVDVAPCFYGDPPEVEFIGKISGDPIHKDGFDHEQKGYEVKKALARGEEHLGQKEAPNTRVPKEKKGKK